MLKGRMPTPATSVQACLGDGSQGKQARRQETFWWVRKKPDFICSWNDCLWRRSDGVHTQTRATRTRHSLYLPKSQDAKSIDENKLYFYVTPQTIQKYVFQNTIYNGIDSSEIAINLTKYAKDLYMHTPHTTKHC